MHITIADSVFKDLPFEVIINNIRTFVMSAESAVYVITSLKPTVLVIDTDDETIARYLLENGYIENI